MSVNAIEAIKNHYNTLDEQGKLQFQKETGFNLSSLNLMDPKVAERYCKTHDIDTSSGSLWSLYDKGKSDYQKALNRYNSAQNVFSTLNSQKTSAESKYNTLLANYKAENGDGNLTSAQKSSLAQKSGYTTDLINNTRSADLAVDLALDARRNAVNTQRRGLMDASFDAMG